MTPLRQRMLEDMQMRNLSRGTQMVYLRAVLQLARHSDCAIGMLNKIGNTFRGTGPPEVVSLVRPCCQCGLKEHSHFVRRPVPKSLIF